MGVLALVSDHVVEICDGPFMLVYHLVGLGSLMEVDGLGRAKLDALAIRKDRLFELLKPAVGKSDVIEDVGFIS